MTHYPASILNLIKKLSKLPGVGEKTAERLTLHILRSPVQDVEALAASIVQAREKTRLCSRCFGLSDDVICNICSSDRRDPAVLCVVEQPGDMVAIEKSSAFQGLYHILGGTLSPMDGIGPDDIRLRELVERVRKGEIREVVLATSTTVEGDATASYIAECIQGFGVVVTRIASGVPIGGDLKYVDQVTLKRAMDGRRGL